MDKESLAMLRELHRLGIEMRKLAEDCCERLRLDPVKHSDQSQWVRAVGHHGTEPEFVKAKLEAMGRR